MYLRYGARPRLGLQVDKRRVNARSSVLEKGGRRKRLLSLSLSIVHVHVHVPPTPTLLFFFLSPSHCFDLLIMRDDKVSNFYPHVLRTVLVGSQD